MYNMPVGSSNNPYDEDGFVCDYCNDKFDNDNDGEFVNDHMVCKDCLEYYCVKTGDGYISKEKYHEALREAVELYFELERDYFKEYHEAGYLRKERDEALKDIEKLHKQVATFVEHASYFYFQRLGATLDQLLHIIDYLFDTELE